MLILKMNKHNTFEGLESLLKKLDSQNKHIIFADDFNIFFNLQLEAKGGKPFLKRNPLQN